MQLDMCTVIDSVNNFASLVKVSNKVFRTSHSFTFYSDVLSYTKYGLFLWMTFDLCVINWRVYLNKLQCNIYKLVTRFDAF